jgi:hypothetical protein
VYPGKLELFDRVAGTCVGMPFGELSPEVQAKLRGDKFDPFAKYSGDPVRTTHDIPVSKPLTLKRSP